MKNKNLAKFGRSTALGATLAFSVTLGQAVQAQTQAQSDSDEGDFAALEQIVVTGTRRLDRTIADSAVPIDVLTAADLNRQGFTETNQILANLLPSFNFPLPSITDGTDTTRPATLRGLGPDHTLVLVNGKRRHTSALLNVNGSVGRGSSAVDLNMIPASAIERIEVLRDGAAAQYGSDAIAGVINVVLKTAPEGGSISATYGQHVTTISGVPEFSGVATGPDGRPLLDSRGNVQLIPTGKDRSVNDGETLTIQGNIGLPIGERGFFNVSGEYRDRNPTNRQGFDSRVQFSVDDPREITANRLNHRFGNADVRDISVFYNMGYNITDEIEFYSFASLGDRQGESAGFFRRPNDNRTTPEVQPNGFLPFIVTDVEDQSAAAGVRGALGEWQFDTSFVYGEDEFNFGVENSLNTSLGPLSPTEFDAGGLRFRHYVLNADVQRMVDVGFLDNPVSVAFGAEYRDERYQVKAGETASFIQGPFPGAAGSQVFPGFQPSNEVTGDRNSWAVYADIDADITENWNIAIAGRFEDFSDFGSTLNGKIATRYQVIDGVALRGAVSSGFRAPSLSQQFFTSTATNFIDGIPNEVGTFPVESDVALALGATPLDAEESLNLSAGFVLDPLPGLNIAVDFYRIKIDDRIVLTENLPANVVVPLLEGIGITGVQRARFFINGIDTRTRGVDVVATYSYETNDFGLFRFTGGFNYNETDVTELLAAPGPLAQANLTGDDLFGRLEQLRFEKGQPKTKTNLAMNWLYDELGATLRFTRFGETLDPGSTEVTDEIVDSAWITDIELRYDFNDWLQLAAGANNLFDKMPNVSPTGALPDGSGNFSIFNDILPFSSFSPFGFNGRFIYARATVSW
ncbi:MULTISPECIES: TonB-dependent receptor [unclassified Iodidimonas]|jgi:iron complex outermembrane receptor protein|uniref:TonB-dependent receptor plug domain-containing protein n=1 Tax=unclassified Iodidimonas TaxID=2626145 RepID=UPI002482E2E3|nr:MULTISPECIES: TonB-dependent receptor [unclassified Iodidimonas]